MNIQEVNDVITELNNEIITVACLDTDSYDYLDLFTLESKGSEYIVKFLGTRIWYSEDAPQEYLSQYHNCETLEDYLRREAHGLLVTLSEIHL